MASFLIPAVVVATMMALVPCQANAQYAGPGSNAKSASAFDAAKAPDDLIVVLEGTLVRQITSDTYEFRDSSGAVTVDIDPEDFPATKVDASTPVRLFGEVDRDWHGMDVDIKRMEVLKATPGKLDSGGRR